MKATTKTQTDVSPLDKEIRALVQQVREYQQAIAENEQAIAHIKQQLTNLLEERGSNWSDEYGYARLTSEGSRIDYETKALDELIISDPLRYGWLKEYRKEIPVTSHIQIR